jgi:aldose 1-epimerase
MQLLTKTHVLILASLLALVGQPANPAEAAVEKSNFGKTADGTPVELYTLKNKKGMVVKIMTRGATVVELHVPDKNGKSANVVLGFDNLAGYESKDNQHFGGTVGRVCNRIAKGKFTLDGKTYELAINNGPNALHGGTKRSLDKIVWAAGTFALKGKDGDGVLFSYVSPDGEEGFPGKVNFTVTYFLSSDSNTLSLNYLAETDKATPINLTNHSYFNLAGAGTPSVLDHVLMLNADKYTPVDDNLIPTGKIEPVKDTPLDFTKPTKIGARIEQLIKTPTKGYDHNFVIKDKPGELRLAAKLTEPTSGRVLTVNTTQPGIQCYSGNFLVGQKGAGGKTFPPRCAFCLETQHFPDSVNHKNFPTTILGPGEKYLQTTEWEFTVQK